jgi:hypothetical protein
MIFSEISLTSVDSIDLKKEKSATDWNHVFATGKSSCINMNMKIDFQSIFLIGKFSAKVSFLKKSEFQIKIMLISHELSWISKISKNKFAFDRNL